MLESWVAWSMYVSRMFVYMENAWTAWPVLQFTSEQKDISLQDII